MRAEDIIPKDIFNTWDILKVVFELCIAAWDIVLLLILLIVFEIGVSLYVKKRRRKEHREDIKQALRELDEEKRNILR